MPLQIARHPDTSPKHTLIIAEIGVNHDGCVNKAQALIRHAQAAGADAVKLQLFQAQRLLSAQARLAGYQRGKAQDPFQLLQALELPLAAVRDLTQAAVESGLSMVVTPFSLQDAEDLQQMPGLSAVKIASPDAINTPLMDRCLDVNLPVLVSTGTCSLAELEPAIDLLHQRPAQSPLSHAVFHCVSAYPTPNHLAALGGIQHLQAMSGLPTGYSDHTPAIATGALAAAAGAVLLEKHLTYDRQAHGPDHAASLPPDDFAEYVARVREADAALGPIGKHPHAAEVDVKTVSRQSVCATQDRPAGHVLTREDLTLKRPGDGIPPGQLQHLIGRRLAKPIRGNHLIPPESVAGFLATTT